MKQLSERDIAEMIGDEFSPSTQLPVNAYDLNYNCRDVFHTTRQAYQITQRWIYTNTPKNRPGTQLWHWPHRAPARPTSSPGPAGFYIKSSPNGQQTVSWPHILFLFHQLITAALRSNLKKYTAKCNYQIEQPWHPRKISGKD